MKREQTDKNKPFSLKQAFREIGQFGKNNRKQSVALLGSLAVGADALLGTSALTPVIATSAGATAALAAALWVSIQNGKTTVQNALALGSKLGLAVGTLGVLMGSLNTGPETFVSVSSVLQGAVELGTGNIVGSNIVHSLVVLGLPAAMLGIAKAKDLSWKFNTYVMAGTTVLFGSQMLTGTFDPYIGGAMLLLGGYYLNDRFFKNRLFNTGVVAGTAALFGAQLLAGAFNPVIGGAALLLGGHHFYERFFKNDKPVQNSEHKHEHGHKHDHNHEHDHGHDHSHHHHDDEEIGSCAFHDHGDDEEIKTARQRPGWFNAALAGGGMLGLMATADLIVRSGVSLADTFNLAGMNVSLSQAAIGALVIAIGTSVPEIILSIEAIRKKHSDMAIGNALGCGIVNTLVAGGILSLTGAAVPQAFNLSSNIGMLHTGFFLGTATILTGALHFAKGGMNRVMGGLALAAYVAYAASAMYLNDGKMPDTHNHHTQAVTGFHGNSLKEKNQPAIKLHFSPG